MISMKTHAHKIGAVFFALWGLLHVVGASALIAQVSAEGATGVFATLGSAVPASNLPVITNGLADAVLTYYAWNILWPGLFALAVAVGLNWKNSRTGYWLNMIVVGAVDLGLIVTLIAPGYMAVSDGMLGITLWIPAAIFSTLGLATNRTQRAEPVALA